MPRGRKKKVEAVEAEEAKNEIKQGTQAGEPLPMLGPNQKYFEAPDGTVIPGDANLDRVWYRKGEMWINPKR
jgi:hypothetical protein